MTTLPDTDTSKVIHYEADEGPTVWFNTGMYTFKATGETTNGALTFAEGSILPGDGPPPHYHENMDEAFYVLQGGLDDFLISIGREPHAGEIPPPFTPEQHRQIDELAPNYGLIIG